MADNDSDGSVWNGPEYPFTTPYYPGIDYNEDRCAQLIAIAVSWTAISFATIVLRVISRLWSKVKLGLDDWLIYIDAILVWGYNGLVIAEASINGFGQHIGLLSYWQVRHFRKGLYALTIMYPICLTISKLSLLAFYWRVFKVPRAKWPLIIVTTFNVLWLLSAIIAGALACVPPDHLFNPFQVGGCEDLDSMYLANEAITMALDLVVLLMPVYFIAHLRQSRSWKFNIILTFLLGLAATVVSALREWRLAVNKARGIQLDLPFAESDAAIWSTIEVNLWVLVASIPALRPLIHLVARSRFGRMLGVKLHPLNDAGADETRPPPPEPALQRSTIGKEEETLSQGRASEGSSWTSAEQKESSA